MLNSTRRALYILLLGITFPFQLYAQVGEYRNDWSVGANYHYSLTRVSFTPNVQQSMKNDMGGGLMVRYTCERYFNMICSLQAEVNYTRLGWKEKFIDTEDKQIVYSADGTPLSYQRTLNYIQIPIMAHLAYGKEKHGVNIFLNAGPQFGYALSESTDCKPGVGQIASMELSQTTQQHSMTLENRFDYGIAVGAGIEGSIKHFGRLQLEGRYYYGLGNIYGDSKRDYFGSSNHQTITIRAAYLFDL